MSTVPMRQPTRVDSFVGEVLPADKRDQLLRSLPRHIKPELFERNLINAAMNQPDLLKCDPREVFREVSAIAALGLMLDVQLGEAYLIVGYSKKEGRHKPQRRVGYRGLIKLARNSGEVASMYARDVRQNDDFSADLYKNDIEHAADLFGDRGPVIGFYAVVRYRDGTEDFEPMSLAEVHRIRDRYSDSYRAWKSGAVKKPPPWETDEVEMGKKTVLRRLIKRVPQSPELLEALKLEEEREPVEDQLSPPRGRPRLAASLQQLADPARAPADEPAPPDNGDPGPGDDDEGDGGQGDEGDKATEPSEAETLLAAMIEKAGAGSTKLRLARAKLTPEQLALLSKEQWEQLTKHAALADKPPRAEQ